MLLASVFVALVCACLTIGTTHAQTLVTDGDGSTYYIEDVLDSQLDISFTNMKKSAKGIFLPKFDYLMQFFLEIPGMLYSLVQNGRTITQGLYFNNELVIYYDVIRGRCIPVSLTNSQCITKSEMQQRVLKLLMKAVVTASKWSKEAIILARFEWFKDAKFDFNSYMSMKIGGFIQDLIDTFEGPITNLLLEGRKLYEIMVGRYLSGKNGSAKLLAAADAVAKEVIAIYVGIGHARNSADKLRTVVTPPFEVFSTLYRKHLERVYNTKKTEMDLVLPKVFKNYWDILAIEYAVTILFSVRNEVGDRSKVEMDVIMREVQDKLRSGDIFTSLSLTNDLISSTLDTFGQMMIENLSKHEYDKILRFIPFRFPDEPYFLVPKNTEEVAEWIDHLTEYLLRAIERMVLTNLVFQLLSDYK